MPREGESGRIDFVLPCRRCATLMGGDSRRGKKLRFETRINAAIQGLCTKNTTSIRHPTEPTTTRIANGRYGGNPAIPIGRGEGPLSTHLRRSRRVSRTAGVGHKDAFPRPRLNVRYPVQSGDPRADAGQRARRAMTTRSTGSPSLKPSVPQGDGVTD